MIIGQFNDSAGTGFELLPPVSLIAGASRFVRQDVYRSRLPRSIGNGNQCASLVSLTLACAAESKSTPIAVSLSGSTGTREDAGDAFGCAPPSGGMMVWMPRVVTVNGRSATERGLAGNRAEHQLLRVGCWV